MNEFLLKYLWHFFNFIDFDLITITEDGKLNLLLKFATGLETIPPLGIDPQPSISFGHPEDLQGDVTAAFPMANTCANTLRIPVLRNYETFRKHLISTIDMVKIFTTE